MIFSWASRNRNLQSSTKLLRHFTKFILFIRDTITNVFNPPPPRQCCQCCCVVKTKSGEWQTPRNNIERGRGGIKYSLPACKSRHSWQMCDIRLFQPLLSMIVGYHITLVNWKGADNPLNQSNLKAMLQAWSAGKPVRVQVNHDWHLPKPGTPEHLRNTLLKGNLNYQKH